MYEDSTAEALGMLGVMILIVVAIVFSLNRDEKRKSRMQQNARKNPQQVQHQFDSSDFNTAAGLLAYIRENPDENEAELVGKVASIISSTKQAGQARKKPRPQIQPQYSPYREPAVMPEQRIIERPIYVERPRHIEQEPVRPAQRPRRIRRDPYYDERDDFYDEY